MAVGGIAINFDAIKEIEQMVLAVRDKCKLRASAEIKWSNVKARRENAHKEYAALLFNLCQEKRVHFHIRFQRVSDWNHEMSGPRKKTDTVSRAYYQLLLHRPIGFYGHQAKIFVRPDNGECTEKLSDFVGHLNTDARKKKNCKDAPIRSIECQDSKKCHGLQLLDVTLGGFAAIRNGRYLRPEVSKVKKELAEYIKDLWGNPDLTKSSPPSQVHFNVWNAKPSVTAPRR